MNAQTAFKLRYKKPLDVLIKGPPNKMMALTCNHNQIKGILISTFINLEKNIILKCTYF